LIVASSDIPSQVREEVARVLYRRAGELDWDLMADREKTAQYRRWLDDASVGGVLTQHVDPQAARLWIKDGPMKEYDRALEGFGVFARFVTARFAPHADLIHVALGDQWKLAPNSVGEKPMHCLATDGVTRRYVCWGRPDKISDLIWDAVKVAVKSEQRPLLVVSLRDGVEVTGEERRWHQAIASHCQLDIRHMRRKLYPQQVR
jgi:hypothetical protein